MRKSTCDHKWGIIEITWWKKKKRIAKKLHCQFGHSSAEKLKKLLKSANIRDQKLNRETDTVKRICIMCIKYKKPKLGLTVRFSLSKDFMSYLKDINYCRH